MNLSDELIAQAYEAAAVATMKWDGEYSCAVRWYCIPISTYLKLDNAAAVIEEHLEYG